MLIRTLKMAFWITYDHLGKLLVINVLCMVVALAPGIFAWAAFASGDPGLMLAVGGPCLLLIFGVILPVSMAGLAHLVKELIEVRDASIRPFFAGVREYALRAVGLAMVFLGAGVCLLTSTWFYAARLGARLPWAGYALSALALWCLVFLALMALMAWPALAQKKQGVRATLTLSAFLVLDNPFFCFGVAVQAVMGMALWVVPPVLAFFSVAPLVVLMSSAYEILARKYAAIEARAARGEAMRNAPIDFGDDTDDYLSRGFRDFLFPWKG